MGLQRTLKLRVSRWVTHMLVVTMAVGPAAAYAQPPATVPIPSSKAQDQFEKQIEDIRRDRLAKFISENPDPRKGYTAENYPQFVFSDPGAFSRLFGGSMLAAVILWNRIRAYRTALRRGRAPYERILEYREKFSSTIAVEYLPESTVNERVAAPEAVKAGETPKPMSDAHKAYLKQIVKHLNLDAVVMASEVAVPVSKDPMKDAAAVAEAAETPEGSKKLSKAEAMKLKRAALAEVMPFHEAAAEVQRLSRVSGSGVSRAQALAMEAKLTEFRNKRSFNYSEEFAAHERAQAHLNETLAKLQTDQAKAVLNELTRNAEALKLDKAQLADLKFALETIERAELAKGETKPVTPSTPAAGAADDKTGLEPKETKPSEVAISEQTRNDVARAVEAKAEAVKNILTKMAVAAEDLHAETGVKIAVPEPVSVIEAKADATAKQIAGAWAEEKAIKAFDAELAGNLPKYKNYMGYGGMRKGWMIARGFFSILPVVLVGWFTFQFTHSMFTDMQIAREKRQRNLADFEAEQATRATSVHGIPFAIFHALVRAWEDSRGPQDSGSSKDAKATAEEAVIVAALAAAGIKPDPIVAQDSPLKRYPFPMLEYDEKGRPRTELLNEEWSPEIGTMMFLVNGLLWDNPGWEAGDIHLFKEITNRLFDTTPALKTHKKRAEMVEMVSTRAHQIYSQIDHKRLKELRDLRDKRIKEKKDKDSSPFGIPGAFN